MTPAATSATTKHVSLKVLQRCQDFSSEQQLQGKRTIANEGALSFRMRQINPVIRNKSQKLLKTGNTTQPVSSAPANYSTARKLPKKTMLHHMSSENSDLMTENKSHRNLLSSEGTHSTNASSKLNTDSFEKEPNRPKQSVTKPTLFRSTPKSNMASTFSQQTLLSSRQRTIRRAPKQTPRSNTLNIGQVMINRWMGVLKNKLPQFDLEDEKLARLMSCDSARRQTAPEYAQHAYLSMLKSERAIGNYFELPRNSLRISPQDRESMVSLIQELHRVKGYAEDTFYLAVSIADRYLTVLATKGQKAPNLIQLATISILLAAKMYQHMNPCFDMMIERLPTLLREQVTREQLIGLEELIIRALDFDL